MTTSHGRTADGGPVLWPQLGDLALDIAQGERGRVGVIVGVPGEEGSDWLTYHLQPAGGGEQWSAAADASTLRPVPDTVASPCEVTAGAVPLGGAPSAGVCLPGRPTTDHRSGPDLAAASDASAELRGGPRC